MATSDRNRPSPAQGANPSSQKPRQAQPGQPSAQQPRDMRDDKR